MRRRRRSTASDDAEVMLSPLIDCVFLLLIFFLVTSMLKRFERQIPVQLADPTAAVAETAADDVYLIGIDRGGNLYEQAKKTGRGVMTFRPVKNPADLLQSLVSSRGPAAPVELVVEREAPFQKVIDVLDLLELRGFKNVSSRVRDTDL